MSKSVQKSETDQIRGVMTDAAARIRDLADNLGDQTDEAVHEASRQLMKSARKLAKYAKSQSKTAVRYAGKEIKEHPVAAASIAASAAAIIGLLVLRNAKKS